MPFVYMVICRDGTLYTGWTTDVEARVSTHNAGRGSIYCKHRRPVHLVYQEELPTRSTAQKREIAIKRLPRLKKLELSKAWAEQKNPPTSPLPCGGD
jgi:putative endonuclease